MRVYNEHVWASLHALICPLHAFVQITTKASVQAAVKQGRGGGGQHSLCGALMRCSSVPKWDEHACDKEVQAGDVSVLCCYV